MTVPMRIAINSKNVSFHLLGHMANRHGLIAGATGTGKTVTLQTIAERLSENGVPVFLADVKGDLAGISQKGAEHPKIMERIKLLSLSDHCFQAYPVRFWDVFGQNGHPLRATVSDMGPLLMGRLLSLNAVQNGVLNLIFKIADDNGLLLLDLKDIRSMVQYVGDHASEFTTEYGNIAKASVGAIQRGLLELETQEGEQFFGEPMLDIFDLIQTGADGKGVINILSADKLITRPKVYSTFLLWLLAELFERLPEVGDLEKPKMVFFFDEAHFLFEDATKVLLDKIKQVIRLIRSRGVGVYFATQNPRDVPDPVLAQLGNRVQHALRAFTPLEQKAVKLMAQTFRHNPEFDIEKVITELGTGEALISFLEEKGTPAVVNRAFVCPPQSRLGTITNEERRQIIRNSIHFGRYEQLIDRESAFEVIKKRTEQIAAQTPPEIRQKKTTPAPRYKEPAPRRSRSRSRDTLGEAFAKSTMRSFGSSLGRQILRGILGSILGKK